VGATKKFLVAALLVAVSCQSEEPSSTPKWNGPPPQLVSVSTTGKLGNSRSSIPYPPVASVVTPNGRLVAFDSRASNLVPEDTTHSHEFAEIFVRDMKRHTTERINVDSRERQANQAFGPNDYPRGGFPNTYLGGISDDGRYVVFATTSSNLVPRDTNRSWDVFLRDRWSGTTTLVSRAPIGAPGNRDSFYPVISVDGGTIAFASRASNLVHNDTNHASDVFVYNVATRTTTLASTASDGTQADGDNASVFSEKGSSRPSVSADGSVVAFSSTADNLVEGDTNDLADVFVRDLDKGTTIRVSVSSDGEQTEALDLGHMEGPYGNSSSVSLSGDGTVVMFTTMAPNLVDGDTNDLPDTFVHDLKTGKTERISVTSDGEQVTGCTDDQCLYDKGSAGGSLSFDGRFAAFTSGGDLVPGDADHPYGADHDVFIRDRASDETMFVTYRVDGQPAAPANLYGPSLSSNGRWLVYGSDDKHLVRRTEGHEAFGWVFLQKLPAALFRD